MTVMANTWTPWTNPVGLAAARRQCNAGFSGYGDILWDIITAEGSRGEPFRRVHIARELARYAKLAPKTADLYTGAFIAYARACPEEFSGPASLITKRHNGSYYLADAPER